MSTSENSACIDSGIGVLSLRDAKYPQALRDIANPPEQLFYIGDVSALNGGVSVAMVGARVPSMYGVKQAERISYELAANGVTIVSGMARGVDTLCHKGALKANGVTVAVLGCGLDICYPHENADLMRVIARNGVVISEFPAGTPPRKEHFPQRNRIISGLAKATIVVECKERSGTMSTVKFARDAGRDVWTLPVNLDNQYGSGNIALLKSGARMLTSSRDVLDSLAVDSEDVAEEQGLKMAGLSPRQVRIVKHLHESEPIHIDEISMVTGIGIIELNGEMTILELKKKVRHLAGKHYVLN